jgi:leucyl-tRNA synthetase
MAEYNHREVEKQWQKYWEENQTYKVEIDKTKPKYYVLDMFPYPSGAGLHVGHPLGYIASDIVSRYKRLKGFNVLHPMGFDSFGLPAEQYAMQTGQHPAITTEVNSTRYIQQLKNIGFSYDWSRELSTSKPDYYKWTQWIFMELFNSWYNQDSNKAESIETLFKLFSKQGTENLKAVCDDDCVSFSADEWDAFDEETKYAISLKYRMTFLADAKVNWCAELGSVLSNDEVKDGVSERGGYPVEQKVMRQWMMRITAYADRLINDLELVDWTDSMKEQQKNWIGRSVGAEVIFDIENFDEKITVYTTRVDTIYGVSFMVLAPEHELVAKITTKKQKTEIENYIADCKLKSELDRTSDTKTTSGAFTGAFCINPFNQEKVQIWIADYVLAGYGTGAVMGVPSGDQRDWNFATKYNLPVVQILDAQKFINIQADNTKEGKYINSGIINGLNYKEANTLLINWLRDNNRGKGKVMFRLRDAVFSRQRYWGEPVPVYFEIDSKGNKIPKLIDKAELPLVLPKIDEYKPTTEGEPPLGRSKDWKYKDQYEYELSTMPGWAGSSFYFYRYMDSKNDNEFASKEAIDYWQNVDLYVGGTEHATGHLLYSRFWNKFLFDKGLVPKTEYASKLLNQGMIQGRSNFVYRLKNAEKTTFVSHGLKNQYDVTALHVDVNIVQNEVLDIEKFKATRNDIDAENVDFILEDGKYICGVEVEKMSKSKFNVVNPDDVIERYGADTLRMYEMFLGPVEDAKPWNTNGIDGVFRFVRKINRLVFDENGKYLVNENEPNADELRILHKAIKKVQEEIERYSFNTVVSTLMVCLNELNALKCHKKAIIEPFLILLSPYAPHISEELWSKLGNEAGTITKQSFPIFNPEFVVESNFDYPIQINGKVRANVTYPMDKNPKEIEADILTNEVVLKWLDGNAPKKVIVVPKRIINIVL